MKEVYSQFKKIDDKFLSLFEKKYIIFIEDGTDLKDQLPSLGSTNTEKQPSVMSHCNKGTTRESIKS